MKFLIIGDEHWGISNMNSTMIQQNIDLWNYLFKIIESYNIDAIIDLGDFFDKRKEIDSNLLSIVKKNVLDRLSIPMYMIVGNHNLYYKDSSTVNNLEPLGDYSNLVHIVKSPTRVGQIDLIPWINSDNINEITSFIETNGKYCCGHFEFSGFSFDKYNLSSCKERISQSLFKKKYDKIFSGHYHISSSKDNIIYVGSPIQLTWIDVNVSKSFIVFNDETGNIEATIENPFELYGQYNLDDSTIDEISNLDTTNKRIRIFYEEDWASSNKDKLIELKNKLNSRNPDIIQYIKKPKKSEIKSVEIDEHEDLEEIIEKYIDRNDYKNKELLKKFLRKIGESK